MTASNRNEIYDLTNSFTLADHTHLNNVVIDLDTTDESFREETNIATNPVPRQARRILTPCKRQSTKPRTNRQPVQTHDLCTPHKQIKKKAKKNKTVHQPLPEEPEKKKTRKELKLGCCPICFDDFGMGTDSERTDTEELVGRAASQCSAPPDLLPSEARALLRPGSPAPPAPPAPPPADDKPRLRFEELTCDVELQHPESSKQKPVQFSFTLYDLDGHGRMTKDDIAGIVSTIYESIGKSVTVPHYGSKTIKVRLTVVPEDDNTRSHRERRDCRRRRRRETTTTTLPEEHEPSEEEGRERSPDDDVSSKSSCSGDQRPVQRPPPLQPSRMHRYHRKEHRDRKHTKKRSGSLQRRELFEIIQANMEKNHLSFQSSRKPSESVANEEEIINKYQKLRNRSYTINERPSKPLHSGKSDHSGHGYLDLACGGDSNLCRYDRYLHAVICSSARHAHTGFHQKQAPRPRPTPHHPHPPRSPRSHDLPTQIQSSQPRVLQIIFL